MHIQNLLEIWKLKVSKKWQTFHLEDGERNKTAEISSPLSLYWDLKLINTNELETLLLSEKRVSWINVRWKLWPESVYFAAMPRASLHLPHHQYVFSAPEGQNPEPFRAKNWGLPLGKIPFFIFFTHHLFTNTHYNFYIHCTFTW